MAKHSLLFSLHLRVNHRAGVDESSRLIKTHNPEVNHRLIVVLAIQLDLPLYVQINLGLVVKNLVDGYYILNTLKD